MLSTEEMAFKICLCGWRCPTLPQFLHIERTVNVPLNRTFSAFGHSGEGSEEASNYRLWLFRRNNTGLSWSDLLKKRVVVSLGEMGRGTRSKASGGFLAGSRRGRL
jgi:hypothetical protein